MSASEPTIVPSSAAPGGNANGTSTPSFQRGGSASGSGAGAGTFGVKTGLAQMLKGG